MGLMINKNFNDKWIQKFINLLQGFFYAQYCPFGQEDERKIEQEICNLQRAIIYNGEQVEKWIDNCREFEKALDRSEVFRSVL